MQRWLQRGRLAGHLIVKWSIDLQQLVVKAAVAITDSRRATFQFHRKQRSTETSSNCTLNGFPSLRCISWPAEGATTYRVLLTGRHVPPPPPPLRRTATISFLLRSASLSVECNLSTAADAARLASDAALVHGIQYRRNRTWPSGSILFRTPQVSSL